MKTTILAVLVGLTFTTNLSFASSRTGNGGFLYSRTSKKLLDASQLSLQNELSILLKSRSDLSYSSNECPKPIDFRKLNSIAADLAYNYNDSTSEVNPEGREEKKFFQINKDGKVEATEIYFSSFVDTYFRYEEEIDIEKKEQILKPVRTAIIHEALHLFDYDEMDARKCSENVISVIESYNDAKLKKLQETVNAENDQLVYQMIIQKILNQDGLNYMHRIADDSDNSRFIEAQYIHFAQQEINYINKAENNKLIYEGEDHSNNEICRGNRDCQAAIELAKVLKESRNLFDVAKFLNSIIKFSVEKELPSKL